MSNAPLASLSQVKADFPIFDVKVHDYPLCYLDNAATTQKPQVVIDSYQNYYSRINANIHRGVHLLSEQATYAFENVRKTVQKFINAPKLEEIIFTKGTTEAINLVAHSFGQAFVGEGDEILISALEHHSNIVPWQMLTQRTGAKLRVIPMLTSGDLDLESLDHLLNEKTKLVAITQVSNALGTVNDIKQVIEKAHAQNIPVLIDGAQSVPHFAVDVQALDCDFFTFSSHKVYGPTGVGILYGKQKYLEAMPPFLGGGDMVLTVSFAETRYNSLPYKFEAGTPPIAEVVAFGAALDYFRSFPIEAIKAHEQTLIEDALAILKSTPLVRLIGEPRERSGAISFVMKGVHPHDIGTLLDQKGIAIRSGHHCAMPIMEFYNIPASARVSFGIYNQQSDLEQLQIGLHHIKHTFRL